MALYSVEDFENELFPRIPKILEKNTVQFFKENVKGEIGGLGSGVLFEFESKYYIITASHIFVDDGVFLCNCISDFKIRVSDLYSLENESILGFSQKAYDETKLDLALIKLNSKHIINDLNEN